MIQQIEVLAGLDQLDVNITVLHNTIYVIVLCNACLQDTKIRVIIVDVFFAYSFSFHGVLHFLYLSVYIF